MKIVIVGIAVMCAALCVIFAAGSVPSARENADKESAPAKPPAAGQKALKAGEPAAPKSDPFKDMSAAQIAERIAGMIDRCEDIPDFIPGLKKEQGEDGARYYTFNGSRLDKLDKEQLKNLYRRVAQERTRLTAERINRQLESIRQANRAAEIARQVAPRSQAVIAPMLPQTYQPPPSTRVPRTPPPPPVRR